MSNDLEILAKIDELLAREALNDEDVGLPRNVVRSPVPKELLRVPLSLIIPAGCNKGIAFDRAGNVIGIKLGIVRLFASELFAEICKLTHLERLVFFTSGAPFNVPIEIRNLRKIKLLWLGDGLKSFPKELLDIDLPFVQPMDVSGPSAERSGTILLRMVREPTQRFIAELNDKTRNQDIHSLESAETVLIEEGQVPHSVLDELSKLKGIFFEGDELEDPPLEIARKGRDAVARYFQQRSEGDLPLNELKVILVGNGGSGKTSLVKRIVGETFNPEEPQTHGINIRQWDIETTERQVKLHFWDFGGQEIMHATHQFFLSKRCIYILVLDGRKDEDPEYWLQHIESFGGDSPILLVLNRVDEHPAFDVNRRFLRNKYKGIVDFFRVSCAKNTGLKELMTSLGEVLAKVPMLQTRWPESWFRIKQELDSIEGPFLSLEQYRNLCSREKIVDETNQELLVDFLHDLGVVLHFKDMELLDTHVLDPRWVTDGVYRIINSELVAQRRGLIPLNQIGKILSPHGSSEYPAERHRYIVDLMLKFELCYRIGDRAILVPDLLDIQEPALDFKDEEDALRFVFEYGYLPKSVMPRFIVRMHGDIKSDMRWRTGVVLTDKALRADALVTADEKAKRIYVAVCGIHKRDYFAVIRKVITDINLSFEKLQVTEFVPLPDVPSILIDYGELLGYDLAKRREIFVGRLRKAYDVQSLLNGIEGPAAREAQVVVVQGNYYANPSVTTHSTQIKHSTRISVDNERGEGMEYNAKTWEKAVVYSSGVAFIGLVGYLLVRNQPIADPNLVVAVRTILSVVVALFGATIPGMLRVDFSAKGLTIRAIGALALFVLTFVFTPSVLH